MKAFLGFITATMILIASCDSTTPCDTQYDLAFVVQKGSTYCLPDEGMLKIIDITTSYCPCDAV